MGLFLTIFILLTVLTFLIARTDKSVNIDRRFRINAIIWTVTVSLMVCLVTECASFGGYLTLVRKKSYIIEYAATIKEYQKRALIGSEQQESPAISEQPSLTDLKYQNFQNQLAGMLVDLRSHVESYNANIAVKRRLKSSWYFRLFIIGPDEDMVPYNINTLLEG